MSRAPGRRSYFLALCVICASTVSQYAVGGRHPLADFLLAYGLPIAWITWLCGSTILRRALVNSRAALRHGLAAFGVCSLAGIVVAIGVYYILSVLDPRAANLLHRPLPLFNLPPHLIGVMVWASFLVVGPAEEYIFRGFVFGQMLRLYPGRHWLALAFLSSLLFAAAHLYYVLILGIASLVPLTEVFAIGVAMAVAYYRSGGNLLIPALIHGAFDASGFIALGISYEIGSMMRQSLVLVGLIVAVSSLGRQRGPRAGQKPQGGSDARNG